MLKTMTCTQHRSCHGALPVRPKSTHTTGTLNVHTVVHPRCAHYQRYQMNTGRTLNTHTRCTLIVHTDVLRRTPGAF